MTPTRSRWPDLLALSFLLAFFVAWYAPGILGGLVYTSEDILGKYFALRNDLYNTAHQWGFSWWKPLPGLGVPRLGDLEAGHLSPFSLLFYLVPTATAFAVYPTLVSSLLAFFVYALLRLRGCAPLPAVFGAVAFSTARMVLGHVQHPPFLEALVWLPALLCCWELFRRSGRGAWLVLAALCYTAMCYSGCPQYLVYNSLVVLAWVLIDLWSARRTPRRLVQLSLAALGVIGAGVLLGSWQLLPGLELAQNGQRTLLDASAFADTFRAAPWEVPLALVGEVFWFAQVPPQQHGGGYPNEPTLSAVVVVFALLALLARPRAWGLWAAAVFFLLGMMGSTTGISAAIAQVIPGARELRAPVRMIVPASFLLALLAGLGMQAFLQRGAGTRAWRPLVGGLALAWLLAASWSFHHRTLEYAPPSAFRVPPVVASAQGRTSVDRRTNPPYFALNLPLMAGVPTLVVVDTLVPRKWFEAMFASQIGPLSQRDKVHLVAGAFNLIPINRPDLPLMKSFHLSSLIQYVDGSFREERLDARPAYYVVPAVRTFRTDEERLALAASTDWDPAREALVAEGLALPPALVPGRVRVLRDEPDRQLLEVDGEGGLQVCAALLFPGWSVAVDGRPATPVEANVALRAVVVPAGLHRVEWVYRPAWLPWAQGATGLALLVLVLLACLQVRARDED